MMGRICAIALFVCTCAWAEGGSTLAGRVRSLRSGQPVAGALAFLEGAKRSTVTDSQGSFSFEGLARMRPTQNQVPKGAGDGFLSIERDGQVQIQWWDHAGKSLRRESRFLPRGTWKLEAPDGMPGVHLYAAQGPGISQTGVLMVPGESTAAQEARRWAGGRSLAAKIDTLKVSRSGYRTARVPLDSYQATDLAIDLEDSLATDFDSATFVPDTSWPCYLPDGIPPPGRGVAAFTLVLQIGAVREVGLTQFGTRLQYDLKGGTIKGAKIDGSVQSGGLDYQLILSNGGIEVEQIAILQVGSTPILMRNAGIAPVGADKVRMVLDFEAPNGSPYAWLNTGKFVGLREVDRQAGTIRLEVREVAAAPLPRARVPFPVPSTHQTWGCRTLSGSQGNSVFTETVALGSSISIGASKRGSRNIIPITGGTVTGKVEGKVLAGGADYQLGGLDARYTIQTNDGEFIVIRNCGSGSLEPQFETRAAGPYAFLNQQKYLSSSPNMVGGGVSITFYERK